MITTFLMNGQEKMDDKTVAILGGRGMLGTDLAKLCIQKGYDTRILDLPDFDITNPAQLQNTLAGIPLIVNCAAYTDVDGAETNPQLAHKVNAEAVGHLGRIAKTNNAFLLHVSTDFVFDGKKPAPYKETDPPNPKNTYGRSKLAGEKCLAESGHQYCILRIQWTYGNAGNNFVKKLLVRARKQKELKVVDDQLGSPTATKEVAKAICDLLNKTPQGIFHFAAHGYTSRFEMARFILKKLNIKAKIIPCKTTDFQTPAKRPLNSRFNCEKINPLLNQPVKDWKTALDNFLEQL